MTKKLDIFKYDFIIFDFDGVVADSNRIKTDVFYKLGSELGEGVGDLLKKHHIENLGHNRVKKFFWLYDQLDLEVSKDEFISSMCERFKNESLKEIIELGPTEGYLSFLKALTCPLYIISGANTADLIEITEAWNINENFKEIFGGEKGKIDHINDHSHLFKGRSLVFGDANADLQMAVELDGDFVFINGFTYTKKENLDLREKDLIIRTFEELI